MRCLFSFPRRTSPRNALLGVLALGIATLPLAAQAAQARPALPAPPAPPATSVVYYGQSSWLGVSIADLSAAQAHALGLGSPNGALVKDVAPGSPAAKAGMEAGDVIVAFRGRPVIGVRQLSRLVRETPVHRSVAVRVIRARRPRTLRVTLAAASATWLGGRGMDAYAFHMPPMPRIHVRMPPMPPMPPMPAMPAMDFHFAFTPQAAVELGMSVEDISGQLARYFGDAADHAVLVRRVTPGSAAEHAGLHAGDLILAVGGDAVSSSQSFAAALERHAAHRFAITILRHRRRLTLHLPRISNLRPAAYNAQWAAWATAERQRAQVMNQELAADLQAHAGEWRRFRRDLEKEQVEGQRLARQIQRQVYRQMQQQRKQLRMLYRHLRRQQTIHTISTSTT